MAIPEDRTDFEEYFPAAAYPQFKSETLGDVPIEHALAAAKDIVFDLGPPRLAFDQTASTDVPLRDRAIAYLAAHMLTPDARREEQRSGSASVTDSNPERRGVSGADLDRLDTTAFGQTYRTMIFPRRRIDANSFRVGTFAYGT